jgi:hypothetical protein
LATQLAGLTETLAQTQREVLDAKQASATIVSSNSELRKDLELVKTSAEEASSANALLKAQLDDQNARRERPIAFTHKGNEQQYDEILNIVDTVRTAKLANTAGRPSDVDEHLDIALKGLAERLRLVKIADKHPLGWGLVREYLGTGLGKDEADEKKLKAAEVSLDNKSKRKYDGRGNRGKRGSNRGRYNNQGYYDSYNQSTPVYQMVNPSGGNGAAQFVQVSNSDNQNGYVHNSKPRRGGGGRQLGPCFHCRGPHLVVNCPQLAEEAEEVQTKIEGAFYKKQ